MTRPTGMVAMVRNGMGQQSPLAAQVIESSQRASIAARGRGISLARYLLAADSITCVVCGATSYTV